MNVPMLRWSTSPDWAIVFDNADSFWELIESFTVISRRGIQRKFRGIRFEFSPDERPHPDNFSYPVNFQSQHFSIWERSIISFRAHHSHSSDIFHSLWSPQAYETAQLHQGTSFKLRYSILQNSSLNSLSSFRLRRRCEWRRLYRIERANPTE